MAINFIYDKPLHASLFVECYTGLYFTHTNTFEEVRERLRSRCIYIGDGWSLTNNEKIPTDTPCVLVEFSKENDYTEYEYRIMRIQKKYLSRFKKNLAEINRTENE